MRWSEYLLGLPPDVAAAVVNDVTAGFGTLAFMVRQLVRNGELREIVGALDRAETTLDRAYRAMRIEPERLALLVQPATAPGQPWQMYLANRPDDGGPALLAWLQDAVAQAEVAGEVIAADGTVGEISTHVGAMLNGLQALRAEMHRAS